jgi:hypothetical protein
MSWNQCPYCGTWFFGRKKKYCTDKCRIRFNKVIENDRVRSEIPYFIRGVGVNEMKGVE